MGSPPVCAYFQITTRRVSTTVGMAVHSGAGAKGRREGERESGRGREGGRD